VNLQPIDIFYIALKLNFKLKKLSAVELCGPCPRCGGRDRFSINIAKGVFYCRGCARGGDAIAMVMHIEKVGFLEAVSIIEGGTTSPARAAPTARPSAPSNDNQAIALGIWREASGDIATIAKYLAGRGLQLPDGVAGDTIRFHPDCPFSGAHLPAMVALVRDIVSDLPIGIHRAALDLNGSKAMVDGKTKMALGPIAGGAVKITPDVDVTLCLGIAEGIETALSMRQIPEFGVSPIWSLINSGGLSNFPVLEGVEILWIGVDNDPAGVKAATSVAARWRAVGREAILIRPRAEGADLNDLARGAE
jgi:hypothetical protein